MKETSFLTGSQVYGTPHENSDIDLVVFVDDNTANFLWDHTEDKSGDGIGDDEDYPSIRYGNLNVITITDYELFLVWKDVTEQLKLRAPVTRDEAKHEFTMAFTRLKNERRSR